MLAEDFLPDGGANGGDGGDWGTGPAGVDRLLSLPNVGGGDLGDGERVANRITLTPSALESVEADAPAIADVTADLPAGRIPTY